MNNIDGIQDSKILLTVYVKENQSCTCPVEKPYYSCDFLKPVYYYCGKGKNLVISEQYFPKCTSAKCKAEKNVNKPKRKTLTQADLASKAKKKKQQRTCTFCSYHLFKQLFSELFFVFFVSLFQQLDLLRPSQGERSLEMIVSGVTYFLHCP